MPLNSHATFTVESAVELAVVERCGFVESRHIGSAVLIAGDGEFKLRRQGGHPFADPQVQSLVGKRIRAEGFVSAGQFIMERYEVLPVD